MKFKKFSPFICKILTTMLDFQASNRYDDMKGVSEISQPNPQRIKGVRTMAQAVRTSPVEPFSPSLKDFCRLVEEYSQHTDDPRVLAALCESQAEALRIEKRDVTLENVDLLLNTMLNSLQYMAEAREQKRWPNRVKALFQGEPSQEAVYAGS